MKMESFEVEAEQEGERLDKIFKYYLSRVFKSFFSETDQKQTGFR